VFLFTFFLENVGVAGTYPQGNLGKKFFPKKILLPPKNCLVVTSEFLLPINFIKIVVT